MILDIHTHSLDSDFSIINADFANFHPCTNKYYSIGVHAWEASNATDFDFTKIKQLALSCPQIIAIGETGLDKFRDVDFDAQMKSFVKHIAISEALKIPLIIHCVKAYQEVIKLRKELKPSQAWIIHGFRGNANIAKSLTNIGIFLSIGENFNTDAVKQIPENLLFVESDESILPIDIIYQNVATTRGLSTAQLQDITTANLNAILHRS